MVPSSMETRKICLLPAVAIPFVSCFVSYSAITYLRPARDLPRDNCYTNNEQDTKLPQDTDICALSIDNRWVCSLPLSLAHPR